MKKFLLFGFVICTIGYLYYKKNYESETQVLNQNVVAVNQFLAHPALNAVTNGLIAGLKELKPEISVVFQNAQGNVGTAAQIAKSQAAEKPLAIIGIATPSAQAVAKAIYDNRDVLFGFAAVTDPNSAGLNKVKNVVGVFDAPPLEDLINLVLRILPKTKNIGIIFNPGEINSMHILSRITEVTKNLGLNIVQSPVDSTNNVKIATEKLVGNVDVIYIPQDNMVVSAIGTVTQVAHTNDIPVINNDPSLIPEGVLLSVGTDYFKSGLQLAEMLSKALDAKMISQNIRPSHVKEIKFNDKLASHLGIDISQFKGLEQ